MSLLLLVASAPAATTVGQTAPANPSNCPSALSAVQVSVSAGAGYAVPAPGGVITSWSHRGRSPSAGSGRLVVWRQTGTPGQYLTVAVAVTQIFVPDFRSSYGVQIPVQAGDLVGLHVDADDTGCLFTGGAGDIFRSGTTSEPVAGQGTSIVGQYPSARINVSAVVEPDADADGFGDQTQDACPTEASTQGACQSALETTITEAPKKKTKRRSATFEFTSSKPGSSFECAVDGAGFAACTSPLIRKVKLGKHSFQVRAKDATGKVDETPAAHSWKVKRKRK